MRRELVLGVGLVVTLAMPVFAQENTIEEADAPWVEDGSVRIEVIVTPQAGVVGLYDLDNCTFMAEALQVEVTRPQLATCANELAGTVERTGRAWIPDSMLDLVAPVGAEPSQSQPSPAP